MTVNLVFECWKKQYKPFKFQGIMSIFVFFLRFFRNCFKVKITDVNCIR